MSTDNTKATQLAALQRELKSITNDTAKKAIEKKIQRLENDLESSGLSAKQLAEKLLKAKQKVKQLSVKDFNGLISRLKQKPEYAFLKSMTKNEIKDDLERPAKPVGWRYAGKKNYKTPTKKDIANRSATGVYYEARRERSDVSKIAQLENGGTLNSSMSNEPMIGGTMSSSMAKGGKLKGNQKNLDLNKNGRLDSEDFALLRGNKMAKGGNIDNENTQTVLSNNTQIAHHTQELKNAVKGKNVPGWVVSKVTRAASDLSDATHYLEGENKMAKGGEVGDTIRIAKDMPFMASLSNLYNKDLKVVDVKDVFFASGNQKYYIVELDGEQYEVPGRFTEKKMAKGGGVDGYELLKEKIVSHGPNSQQYFHVPVMIDGKYIADIVTSGKRTKYSIWDKPETDFKYEIGKSYSSLSSALKAIKNYRSNKMETGGNVIDVLDELGYYEEDGYYIISDLAENKSYILKKLKLVGITNFEQDTFKDSMGEESFEVKIPINSIPKMATGGGVENKAIDEAYDQWRLGGGKNEEDFKIWLTTNSVGKNYLAKIISENNKTKMATGGGVRNSMHEALIKNYSNNIKFEEAQLVGLAKDSLEYKRRTNNIKEYQKEIEKLYRKLKMATGGSIGNAFSSVYNKAKNMSAKKIHDTKKGIALDVIDSTKDKVIGNKYKVTLKGAEQIIEDKYAKGGGVGDGFPETLKFEKEIHQVGIRKDFGPGLGQTTNYDKYQWQTEYDRDEVDFINKGSVFEIIPNSIETNYAEYKRKGGGESSIRGFVLQDIKDFKSLNAIKDEKYAKGGGVGDLKQTLIKTYDEQGKDAYVNKVNEVLKAIKETRYVLNEVFVGEKVTYKNANGIPFKGEVIEIDNDGKYVKVRNTIGNIDYIETNKLNKI